MWLNWILSREALLRKHLYKGILRSISKGYMLKAFTFHLLREPQPAVSTIKKYIQHVVTLKNKNQDIVSQQLVLHEFLTEQ